MSEDQLFLGIDSGTQGMKAIVLSTTQKKVISEGYASHDLIEIVPFFKINWHKSGPIMEFDQ